MAVGRIGKFSVVRFRRLEVGSQFCVEEVGKAEVIGRSAEVRQCFVGKRRALFVRGVNAMDGRKRAGITALGRAASKPAKRGLAKRRDPSVVWSVMAGGSAARVRTPDDSYDMTKNNLRPLRNQSMNCKFFVTQFRWPRTTCSPCE